MKNNCDHVGMRKINGVLCSGQLQSNCTFNKDPSTKPCHLYVKERYCQIVYDVKWSHSSLGGYLRM